MIKIDSFLLVCSANRSQQLVKLGILPVACMCYESTGGVWDYAGEFAGQSPVLPAWTKNELEVLIGGDIPTPKLLSTKTDWVDGINMNQWAVYLPKKRLNFINGAEAFAAFLIHLLEEKLLKAEECNARLAAFVNGDLHNPQSDLLHKK